MYLVPELSITKLAESYRYVYLKRTNETLSESLCPVFNPNGVIYMGTQRGTLCLLLLIMPDRMGTPVLSARPAHTTY